MNTQEKIEKMLKKSEVILNAGKPVKHPYICEITGLEIDKPCWECESDNNCKWRPSGANLLPVEMLLKCY